MLLSSLISLTETKTEDLTMMSFWEEFEEKWMKAEKIWQREPSEFSIRITVELSKLLILLRSTMQRNIQQW